MWLWFVKYEFRRPLLMSADSESVTWSGFGLLGASSVEVFEDWKDIPWNSNRVTRRAYEERIRCLDKRG